MEEIICINDVFDAETLEFYKKNYISTPIKDQIYSIRDKYRHTTGEVGLLLNEINNRKVPIKSSFGIINIEPTFSIKRFTTLLGEKITEKKEIENDIKA